MIKATVLIDARTLHRGLSGSSFIFFDDAVMNPFEMGFLLLKLAI
jgi:hypothetical protein